MDKPIAWYDPSNGMVSTDKDCPLFTPLGQVWGLYLKEEAKDEPWEKFCDSNCVWTDHHPDCKLAKDEPVAWVGLNLDNMAEAFHRVIEEHHSRKNPFHDPVNGDAMIALRELRGLIAYMKRNTTPPQRKPLTDEEINALDYSGTRIEFVRAIEAKLKEKNT